MNNKVLNTNDKMKDLTILNAFKLSIYQILVFMLITGQITIPAIFQRRFIKKLHLHILHGFLRVITIRNLSNSNKLKFQFHREFRVSGTK